MGNWTMTIRGVGPHGNIDKAGNFSKGDAESLLASFVAQLMQGGQTVRSAQVVSGGEHEVDPAAINEQVDAIPQYPDLGERMKEKAENALLAPVGLTPVPK